MLEYRSSRPVGSYIGHCQEGHAMDLGLGGKQVLITGGSKGIGLALAHAFAAEGADIIIVSRDKTTLERAAGDVARRHNAQATAHAADLSDAAQRRRLHETFPDV